MTRIDFKPSFHKQRPVNMCNSICTLISIIIIILVAILLVPIYWEDISQFISTISDRKNGWISIQIDA